MNSRNIIVPFSSFVSIDSKEVSITSIRISRLENEEKFELIFCSNASPMINFKASKLAIKIINTPSDEISMIKFTEGNKKKLATLYVKGNYDADYYQKYINALMI